MSRAAQQDDLRPFKRVIHHSLVHGMVLIIPAVVGMMLFSQPIVRLFYERDQFTATSTLMTAGALFWYTPGLIGLLCSQAVSYTHLDVYKRQDKRCAFSASIPANVLPFVPIHR